MQYCMDFHFHLLFFILFFLPFMSSNDRVIVVQVSSNFVIITFLLFDLQAKTFVQSVYRTRATHSIYHFEHITSEIKHVVHGI